MTPDDLKHLQTWLGLSTKELADALGVSAQAVFYWRTGARPIPLSARQTMAFIIREKAVCDKKTAEAIISIPLKALEDNGEQEAN